VGVGPGDPRLMTYLAVETIVKCPVIAVPAKGREHAVSYRIASGIVKDLDRKECLNLSTPMTKDKRVLDENYKAAADQITEQLDAGRDVAYLTLGDPTIYSTYIYIHRIVRERGYETRIVSGVPSFCAAAAKISDSLADRAEQLHIIPSTYDIEEALTYPGSKVLMKAASKLPYVKQTLREKNVTAAIIENCGLPGERIYGLSDDMPKEASYYTTVVVKENEHDRD
jgi:precorrin-2/cobalt-factor-2 C20-methyltransferase